MQLYVLRDVKTKSDVIVNDVIMIDGDVTIQKWPFRAIRTDLRAAWCCQIEFASVSCTCLFLPSRSLYGVRRAG